MKHQSIKTLLGRTVLVAALLALVAGSASAATYNLRTGTATVNYGMDVEMWGYALVSFDLEDGNGVQAGGDTVMVPGPIIYVPAGQGLTINLTNGLGVTTSIVVQGQALTGTPQFDVDGRVTAFTDEAAPTTGSASYTWAAGQLEPGTYLYSSGSHPAEQVHMGLYGAMVVDADSDGDPATLEAYPGVFYDRDIVVLYSEVDPARHNDPVSKTAKALNYKPKYFLVNGDPTGNSVLTDPAADIDSRVLLRFVNAGLLSYVPALLGEDLEWVAEDGNMYPYSRVSYSALLAAGKTMDAIWVPTTVDRHALYDRRLHMTANGYPNGGLRAFLDSGFVDVPVADAGTNSSHVALGTTITLDGSASDGSGTYVAWNWSLVGFPSGSVAALVPDPLDPSIVRITPDVPGTYTARLVVTDDTGLSSAPATVNIFTNLPPVAKAGADQAVDVGAVVSLDGSFSYDPDSGDTIQGYDWVVTAPNTSTFALTGALTSFVANQAGTYNVELTVNDGELNGMDSMVATASVHVNQPPNAVGDFFQVLWKSTGNALNVLVNDSDPDGAINPASLSIVTSPMAGASAIPTEFPAASGNYFIMYTPKNGFKGTDFFTYSICDSEVPAACSVAQVRVNVVK
jgi:FtsP/CotA-like multicopper oxidase with cupredoxin domain